MNDKTSPNQMRVLLRRMRGEKYQVAESKDEPKKDMTMRDMLKITRKLNEQVDNVETEAPAVNKKTAYDQDIEEKKFLSYLDMDVSVKFDELEVFDDYIVWGGIVNGVFEFTFAVTPEENTSKVTFDYYPDFSPDNPENQPIIDRIQTYYDTVFSKYWRENLIQQ
ncbi:MAG: hypothetical protein WC333_00540 [Dehalococcoidia bacterium]|jgi:hypothetical protein